MDVPLQHIKKSTIRVQSKEQQGEEQVKSTNQKASKLAAALTLASIQLDRMSFALDNLICSQVMLGHRRFLVVQIARHESQIADASELLEMLLTPTDYFQRVATIWFVHCRTQAFLSDTKHPKSGSISCFKIHPPKTVSRCFLRPHHREPRYFENPKSDRLSKKPP